MEKAALDSAPLSLIGVRDRESDAHVPPSHPACMDASGPDDEVRRARESRWLRDIARGGSAGRDALDRLLEVYERKVVALCFFKGRLAEAEVEDVLQTFALRIIESADAFRTSGIPSSWIMGIARHLVVDVLRDVRRSRRHDLGDEPEAALEALLGPDPRAAGATFGRTVSDCVRRALPVAAERYPEATFALYARHMEGWGIQELAAHLGRSETATRTFLHTARPKFREIFRHCFDLLTA